MRRSLAALSALGLAGVAVAGCGSAKNGPAAKVASPPAPGTTETAPAQSGCASEQQAGIVAVFGHRQTLQAAQRLEARAETVGFKGLDVEPRGCHDYVVVLHGLRDLNQAHAFSNETARVGLHVRIECQFHSGQGGLAAVFGHRRTEAAALRLRAKAGRLGFRGLKVQQDRCNDWEVALYGLQTAAERRAFAQETQSVGFHIVYVRDS